MQHGADAFQPRRNIPQQGHPLAADVRLKRAEAGDTAARRSGLLYIARPDRIGHDHETTGVGPSSFRSADVAGLPLATMRSGETASACATRASTVSDRSRPRRRRATGSVLPSSRVAPAARASPRAAARSRTLDEGPSARRRGGAARPSRRRTKRQQGRAREAEQDIAPVHRRARRPPAAS